MPTKRLPVAVVRGDKVLCDFSRSLGGARRFNSRLQRGLDSTSHSKKIGVACIHWNVQLGGHSDEYGEQAGSEQGELRLDPKKL